MRGWWNMPCWNGLSDAQQRRLIEHGNLELGFVAPGDRGDPTRCALPATVALECENDDAPGPRFYCVPCAIEYLQER